MVDVVVSDEATCHLVRRLIESLDGPAEAEDGAEDAWAEVIARRIAELDAANDR